MSQNFIEKIERTEKLLNAIYSDASFGLGRSGDDSIYFAEKIRIELIRKMLQMSSPSKAS